MPDLFTVDDGRGKKPRPFACYGDEMGCRWFWDLVDRFNLEPWRPSPEKAPWHVQAKLKVDGNEALINFWPHSGKMQIQNMPSVPWHEAEDALLDLANDLQDPPDVFEEY